MKNPPFLIIPAFLTRSITTPHLRQRKVELKMAQQNSNRAKVTCMTSDRTRWPAELLETSEVYACSLVVTKDGRTLSLTGGCGKHSVWLPSQDLHHVHLLVSWPAPVQSGRVSASCLCFPSCHWLVKSVSQSSILCHCHLGVLKLDITSDGWITGL